jgi:hypothetical protein
MATNTGLSALGSVGIGTPGADLQSQANQESDEERKKRLQQEQQQRLLGNSTGATALGSIYGGYTGAGSIGGAGMGRFGL